MNDPADLSRTPVPQCFILGLNPGLPDIHGVTLSPNA